jgi:hypothetical protein
MDDFRRTMDDVPPLNWRRKLRQATIIMVKADQGLI